MSKKNNSLRERTRRTTDYLILISIITLTVLLVSIGSKYVGFLNSLGYVGAFALSVLGSSTVILPAPSWVAIGLMVKRLNPIILGVIVGVGSGIGEMTGYFLGYSGRRLLNKRLNHRVEKYKKEIHKKGVLFIFFLSAIPNPLFDVVGIAAGALKMKWWEFLIPCVLGKVVRFVVVFYLASLGVDMVYGLLSISIPL